MLVRVVCCVVMFIDNIIVLSREDSGVLYI